MANIFDNTYKDVEIKLIGDEYWDFVVSRDDGLSNNYTGASFPSHCLLSYIDTKDPQCIDEGNKLVSNPEYKWDEAVNDGVVLENIGLTGIDNGLIHYEKDKTTRAQFLEILTGSTYEIPEGDIRFYFTPITGNTQKYEYPYTMEDDTDGKKIASLKGGFFQGFSKLSGYNYQVLPISIENEWVFDVRLRPRKEYEETSYTLNAVHPNNKGIFLYLGTRAENKFWLKYKANIDPELSPVKYYNTPDGYMDDNAYQYPVPCYDDPYKDIYKEEPLPPCEFDYSTAITFGSIDIEDCPKPKTPCEEYGCKELPNDISHFNQYEYKEDNTNCCQCEKPKPPSPCPCIKEDIGIGTCCHEYFLDNYKFPENFVETLGDYFGKDISLEDLKVITSQGFEDGKTGYFSIHSDNKFLIFNRTETGFTTSSWVDGVEVEFTGTTHDKLENYFLLFNRTETGYTTQSIDKLIEEKSNSYDVMKDITNNAIAFIVKDNGSVGYRYLIKDCNDERGWSIMEEYSKLGIIEDSNWSNISIRMKIITQGTERCDEEVTRKRGMKIFIYVNGFLKFISKELPEPNFRKLNDVDDKQEAVPFNISLGGGTQGLCDSVWTQYMDYPDHMLELEKNFGGTFIGDIRSFKFYNCFLDYNEIRRNTKVSF